MIGLRTSIEQLKHVALQLHQVLLQRLLAQMLAHLAPLFRRGCTVRSEPLPQRLLGSSWRQLTAGYEQLLLCCCGMFRLS